MYRRQSFMADSRIERPRYSGIEQLVFIRKKTWVARGLRKYAFIECIMRGTYHESVWA